MDPDVDRPSHDYIVACGALPPEVWGIFRDALGIDEATWMRALAWGIRSVGGIHYYEDSNRAIFENSLRELGVVMEELRRLGF